MKDVDHFKTDRFSEDPCRVVIEECVVRKHDIWISVGGNLPNEQTIFFQLVCNVFPQRMSVGNMFESMPHENRVDLSWNVFQGGPNFDLLAHIKLRDCFVEQVNIYVYGPRLLVE